MTKNMLVHLLPVLALGMTMAMAQDGSKEKQTVPEKLPEKMEGVYDELNVGDLTAVIGDHHDHGSGKPGYTAVRHLSHTAFPYSCFRPRYAGLLHTRGDRKVDVIKISDREVIITPQGSTCGHWERFILTPPHYLDYEYNFYATSQVHSVNWCCYMNTLKDPGIYFLQNREWVRHYSPVHSIDASIAPSTMKELPKVGKVPDSPHPSGYRSFADTFAPLRMDADRSFYFGHFHDMAFIWMFCRGDDIIPYMSPTGGGGPNNPAWDARYWLRDCTPGKKIRLKIRQVLKPFVSNDDCLQDYMKWKAMLDGGELDRLHYPLWNVRGPQKKVFYLEKVSDRPFEVQVFKTQIEPKSTAKALLRDPDGKDIARHDFIADGDEHHYFEMRPDKKHGTYKLEIDADAKSCWNIVSDLYREGLDASEFVTIHKGMSGKRFYFCLPRNAKQFVLSFHAGSGTYRICRPGGELFDSAKMDRGVLVDLLDRCKGRTADEIWSFSFHGEGDLQVAIQSAPSRPAFSAFRSGCLTPTAPNE